MSSTDRPAGASTRDAALDKPNPSVPAYCLALVRKVSFWIGVVAVAGGWALGEFTTLSPVAFPVYVVAGLVALFAAGYFVYRDVARRHERLRRQYTAHIEETTGPPSLYVDFVEGSEYSFRLDVDELLAQLAEHRRIVRESEQRIAPENKPGEELVYLVRNQIETTSAKIEKLEQKLALPDAHLDLLVRLENADTQRVRVQAIGAQVARAFEGLFHFEGTAALAARNGRAIEYPLELQPGEVVLCRVRVKTFPDRELSPSQVAGRLHQVALAKSVDIEVETKNERGDNHLVNSTAGFSLRPLRDIYMDYWRATNKPELLALAQESRPA